MGLFVDQFDNDARTFALDHAGDISSENALALIVDRPFDLVFEVIVGRYILCIHVKRIPKNRPDVLLHSPKGSPMHIPTFGTWTKLRGPEPLELMALAGFEFVIADLEHSPLSLVCGRR